MIYKILYYGDVKIKIDMRIYMKFGDGITKVLEKAFELIPQKAYSDGLIAIIMGFSKKLVTVGKTSCYDKSSIYISGDFLKYEKFHGVLLRELVHELGHAFIESWKDNLFSDKNLYSDFALLKKKIKEKVPEFPENFIKDHSTQNRTKVEDFIRNYYGESEFKLKTSSMLPSPYCLLSIDEFVAYFFEEYYLRDRELVKKYCFTLWKVLENV
jgi:hypothetical protein